MARKLTPDQIAAANKKRRMRHFWSSEYTLDEVCDLMGLSEPELRAYAESLGLGEREEPDVYIPTPEQIRLAAAEIRAGWSPAEVEARRVSRRHGRLQ